MWHSLFEEIEILHNLIFMLQHFIVNNLKLNPSVVLGPVADLSELVVSVTPGFLKSTPFDPVYVAL